MLRKKSNGNLHFRSPVAMVKRCLWLVAILILRLFRLQSSQVIERVPTSHTFTLSDLRLPNLVFLWQIVPFATFPQNLFRTYCKTLILPVPVVKRNPKFPAMKQAVHFPDKIQKIKSMPFLAHPDSTALCPDRRQTLQRIWRNVQTTPPHWLFSCFSCRFLTFLLFALDVLRFKWHVERERTPNFYIASQVKRSAQGCRGTENTGNFPTNIMMFLTKGIYIKRWEIFWSFENYRQYQMRLLYQAPLYLWLQTKINY